MLNWLSKHKLELFPVALLCSAVILVTVVAGLLPKFNPVNSNLTVEAGSLSVITVNQFKAQSDTEVDLLTDISKIDLNKAGNHTVQFAFKGNNYTSYLHIVDTTPPTATPVEKQTVIGIALSADDFVCDIKDCSDVTARFLNTPDFSRLGEQTVTIILTDSFENSKEITAKLTVIKDTEPPVFSGLDTISVREGNTVSYRSGVTATDNRDGSVKFSFDNSEVNLEKAGEYKVRYTATDSSGNTATAERIVKVLPKLLVEEDYVLGLAKDVVAKITTDDMTKAQMADKIFKWVRENMTYVSSPETDIINAAYVGFTKKRGDCMNYYSVTKLLLDECGIENMMVERYGGKTTHYWHLVNVGTGWYHYDTTPQSVADPYRCFMKTDAQVLAYAKSRSDGRSDYYNFDKSKYPERATEKFVLE